MNAPETRRYPLVEIEPTHVEVLLSRLLRNPVLASVERIGEGLTNTILKVTPADGSGCLLLRIFGGGLEPWAREQRVLARLSDWLPVPKVLLADAGESSLPHPALVYRWMEGITLNACRRQVAPMELLSLAEPLGRLLAGVANCPTRLEDQTKTSVARCSSVDELLRITRSRLQAERVRQRLGPSLADALWNHFDTAAEPLRTLGAADRLVHGDLGGRNILVRPDGRSGTWRIVGLIDWESAFTGWALWDVGSLFRYPQRFSEAFRSGFERGYLASGGSLPHDWWRTARLLDAARQIETLDDVRELPVVFADCVELLAGLVTDTR